MSDPIFDHGELPVGMREFPLLDALFGRRSRRFGLGMSIPDGPLAYTSAHPPLSLSDLERTLLVLCGAGVSGWHTGMEHTSSGDPVISKVYRPITSRCSQRTMPALTA